MRVGRYRHYLGAWDAKERVRLASAVGPAPDWRAPTDEELTALHAAEVLSDEASIQSSGAVLAAMTIPNKVRRELWELEWDDDAVAMTPRDEQAFTDYGRRVAGFFRSAGVTLGGVDRACETRLIASAPGVTPAQEVRPGMVALVNVGESECLVATGGAAGAVALRVPPDEGCLVSSAAAPYAVIVPADAEFGLLLELVAVS